jgi:glutamate synthase domain-containing protein 3
MCHNPFLGYSQIHIFSLLKKKQIHKKLKKYIKKYDSEKGCQNAEKIVKNWLRRFKNTKIKI